MRLPEKKVRRLITMMNSVSKFTLPAVKPLIDCFDLAMDEHTLDFLLEMDFLYPGPDEGKYVMATIFPGWIELSSSGVGPRDEKKKAILDRFMDYRKLLKLLNIAPVRMWENHVRTRDKDTKIPA